jgi:SAM-dependent methyltransferase
MNREKNLSRLSSVDVKNTNVYFLHYVSYHRELKKAIQKYASGEVLDIGCGNKPYEKWFEGLITKYVGCDIIQSNLNKVDILSPANNIPIENQKFDTIISTQTIEHVEDHQGLINEAFRLLKPGGYFIVSGPLYWPLHEEPYDFFRFTKHGFRYIMEKSGFEIIEINSNGGKWATAGQALIHAFERSTSNRFLYKVLIFLYHKFKGRKLINYLFLKLDNEIYDESNTMNYVIICQK